MKKEITPVLLLILDGWGVRKSKQKNAIAQAQTPVMDSLMKLNSTVLDASGEAVGLPKGFFGNSEVGHLTIGAGRIIASYDTRINTAIKNKTFFKNKALLGAISHAKKNKSNLHIMGLLSDRGVHSDYNHLFSLLLLCKQKKFDRVFIHCFLDGRDTPPKSCLRYLRTLYSRMHGLGVGQVATIIGRYYAMDRDNRWDRTAKAYHALLHNKASSSCDHALSSVAKMIKEYYDKGVSDEFIPPIVLGRTGVTKNDAVIFYNFREDRARQLTQAFVDKTFTHFKRKRLSNVYFCSFTSYSHTLHNPVAFSLVSVKNTLGEVYAAKKLKQLRIAETEKYAHVTYFFNALRKEPFAFEKRQLICSPRVATYDKTPLMGAQQVMRIALSAIKGLNRNKYKLLVVNFANADMVGHTGDVAATIKAVECVDRCVGTLVAAMSAANGVTVITSDHGNAETMTPDFESSHSHAPVPFIVVDRDVRLPKGGLSCVAPTVLTLAGLSIPKEMKGKSLV